MGSLITGNNEKRGFLGSFVLLFVLAILWPTAVNGASSSREQELAKLIDGAKTEGKVVWADNMKVEESKPLIKAFETKYPFIKIQHSRTSGTASTERLFRELTAGKFVADVFDVGGELEEEFKKPGILMKYDWTKAFNIRPEQLRPDQLFVAVGSSMKGVGYNTTLVKNEDVPKRWEDLLDPKWKGKIVVDTRPKAFVHLMPVWGETRVYDFLKKLAANKPQFRRGQTETIELMAAGGVTMIAGTYRSSMEVVIRKGAPVAMTYFDVIPVTLTEEVVAANAAHPNAAKLLLGWLATEGQKDLDIYTARGIPLPGFNTEATRMAKGKTLSLFVGKWAEREAELTEKALQAMGRE
jgi:iron(III) transport system substrate-binding protein